ncbi:MAG: hypothetical protein ACRD8U_22250 [Pyrinomonadaceae bacterium]
MNKERLVRNDTGLVAFDVNILTWRGTYQFTKATFARAIIDYNTLNSRVRAQFSGRLDPQPRHFVLCRIQRRHELRQSPSIHYPACSWFQTQQPDVFHQDVVPAAQEFWQLGWGPTQDH